MNDESVYDVAIIGGGLAGLCLAIQCADQDFSVVLFEKEEYPFHKVCGEYISLESWDFLQRVGINLSEFCLPIIKKLTLSDSKGRQSSFPLPLGGFGISRFFLDNHLYTLAKSKGVKVFTNSKVEQVELVDDLFLVKCGNKIFRSKTAAGCFGKRSNLDLKWKRPFVEQKPNALNNYIGVKYHIRYHNNGNEIFLHNFYNGYCGLSKIEEGKSCLCYLTTAHNLKSCNNSIEEMQKKILFKNPQLEKVFTTAEFIYQKPLAISQVSFSRKSQVENNVLMLGDAAGMISPLCGNGMSMAMNASKMAFEEISMFLFNSKTRSEMEIGYALSWRKAFSTRLHAGRIIQRLFGGDFSTSIFLKTMQAVPSLSKAIIQSTHGKSF